MLNLLAFLYRNFTLLEHCNTTLSAIVFPDMDWSKVNPKYVTCCFDSMSFPLHFTCMLLFCCILFFDPNRIVFVLPKCNDNLLSTNHLWIELSSTVNVVFISSGHHQWTGDLTVRGSNPTVENFYCGKLFASELWQFRLPRFASVFRRIH